MQFKFFLSYCILFEILATHIWKLKNIDKKVRVKNVCHCVWQTFLIFDKNMRFGC